MKKTLKIESSLEGIRMSMLANEGRNDLIAMFGRGNLQARLMLEALASVERSLDLFDIDFVVQIEADDSIRIQKVCCWLDKRTPAQQALYMHLKEKAHA